MTNPNFDPSSWNSVADFPLFQVLTVAEALETYHSGELEWDEMPSEDSGIVYMRPLWPDNLIVVAVQTNQGWDIDLISINEEWFVSVWRDGDWESDWGWELADVSFWHKGEPSDMGEG